jgi:metal-sulfur cluster biosynthetic enzyme
MSTMTEQVWAALDRVNDPELPMSIVELGLIYDVRVIGDVAEVDMTLTSTGCPLHEQIVDDAREAVLAVKGVGEARVTVVWDPPWTRERIRPTGRKLLASWGIRS